MKVLFVYGTRPEAIKMAPLVLKMKQSHQFEPIVCLTGQHKEMLEEVNDFYEIKADYNLKVMTPGQDLFDVTSKSLLGIRDVLKTEQPDIVLVQGDTTSTFTGALAGFYSKIPVVHIEAGLRTGDLLSPFPEEANRVLVSKIGSLHCAPTVKNKNYLTDEGVDESSVYITGNTGIDSLLLTSKKVAAKQTKIENIVPQITKSQNPFVLLTCHRRESFGTPVKSIFTAIQKLANEHKGWNFIYPLHPNPNIQNIVRAYLDKIDNVHLIGPQPYPEFISLMSQSDLIITDSGGVQEEAPSLGKPVLVIRDTTERPEAVEAGTVKLIGTTTEAIYSEATLLMNDKNLRDEMGQIHNPYGDGTASDQIMNAILKKFKK